MTRLRIVPRVGRLGVSYTLQKRRFWYWECQNLFFDSPKEAVKFANKFFGERAIIEVWQP